MPTMKQLNRRIVEHLSTSVGDKNELEKVLSTSEKDIFRYVWRKGWPNDVQLSIGNLNINRKGESDSEVFRNEGNRLYKEKKLDKALLAYNYAILSSPHPDNVGEINSQEGICEIFCMSEYSEGQYTGLAFAFANRSALLLEMEQYRESLLDINNALIYGYTHSKRHKMFERKIKCLIGLNKLDEAKLLAESLLNNLSKFDMTQNELSQLKKSLKKHLSKCAEECGNALGSHASSPPTDNNDNINRNFSRIFHRGEDVPKVTSARDDRGRISSALQVHRSISRGRHLVSTRDINPGEVLVCEESLSSVVQFDERMRLYCGACLKRVAAPLPCPRCSLVVFCSASCQRAATAPCTGAHALQCSVLPALVALQPELDAALAFSIMLGTNMRRIRNDDDTFKNQAMLDGNVKEVGVNVDDVKPSSEHLNDVLNDCEDKYDFLVSLEGNKSSRNAEDKRDAAITSMILAKLLINVKSFWAGLEIPNGLLAEDSNDCLILGQYIMRLLYNIQCNAHCVKELQLSEETEKLSNYHDVGFAIYKVLSLLNHSCVANCHQSSDGNRKILYSISEIKKGEELTMSYGERYVSHDREHRRQNLSKTYFFQCSCPACQLDWPLYSNLPVKFNLKCCQCFHQIDTATSKCKNCQLVHTTTPTKSKTRGKRGKQVAAPSNVYDAQRCQKEIGLAWTDYTNAHQNILSRKSDVTDRNRIGKLVSLLDRYAHHPNRAYTEAQESLIRWFDQRASVALNIE